MAIELVIGIVVVALLAGVGIGYYLLGAGRANKAKAAVAELENALETAQTELADYKRDVFGEFAQTAEKFRALDKSYQDLHRQLAESSVALCGDDGTLLLESPEVSPLDIDDEQLADEEIVVAEAPEPQGDELDTASSEADASEDTAAEIDPQNDADSETPIETKAEPETEAEAQADGPSAEVLQDNNRGQDPDAVPILTEVESNRRESA